MAREILLCSLIVSMIQLWLGIEILAVYIRSLDCNTTRQASYNVQYSVKEGLGRRFESPLGPNPRPDSCLTLHYTITYDKWISIILLYLLSQSLYLFLDAKTISNGWCQLQGFRSCQAQQLWYWSFFHLRCRLIRPKNLYWIIGYMIKIINYKVLDIIELYSFDIKFVMLWFHIQKL